MAEKRHTKKKGALKTEEEADGDQEMEEEPIAPVEEVVQKRPKVFWGDDLSSDSEEEKERELAKLEAERIAAAELTVSKAEYTPEDLEKLVKYIKDMTTLYDLRESDWNKECFGVIREFLVEIRKPMLCLFFDGDRLSAMLSVPSVPVFDLMYFLREPDMVFTVDRFHDEVTFGNFVESVEESLMKVLEFVYAPFFFETTTWPNSVKSEFCTQIHTFLAKLTDLHYKMYGLTVIYIPREGLNITVEEASANKEMVKRLEGVVVYWTHQIKSCIEDQKSVASQYELLCPSDEYEFWVYRYENLCCLDYQIQNPAVKHITKILLTTHSTYINQFQSLCDDITHCIMEARSNVEFLQIIKQPCAVLECVTDPDEIPGHIANILNLFRVIWLESPYYNSTEKMTNLFKALSNQVIILCSNYIDLESLFKGNTRKTMGEFSKCIDCCRKYRDIYDLVSEAHNDKRIGSWDLDNGFIFNFIDSFVQRCLDMLEVCNGMIIFGRIDETEIIAKPQFGGSRGKEFETVCEKVEKLFLDALVEVEKVQDSIMKVQISSWYADILKFRSATKNIEVILENLVNSVFEMVNNVEEGVLALFSLYNYSKRKNLKRIFKKKTSDVWLMFSDEIQDVKKDMVAERNQYPGIMPYYSGCASMIFMRKARLIYLKKIMDEAAWMMPCSNSSDVLSRYKKLIFSIDSSVRELWMLWTNTLEDKLSSALNRSLMARSPGGSGFLECNIDKVILEVCAECRWWENLQLDIPTQAFQIYLKFKNTNFVYQSVLGVVKGYNRILDSLSDEERLLFKPLIAMCDKKILPGLVKLNWNSTLTDAYITDCFTYIGEVQRFLDDYKKCNLNIVLLMEKICDTKLIEFEVYSTFNLKEIQKEIKQMEHKAIIKLLETYKEIITYLIIVFEGFEPYIQMMAVQWVSYVKKFDLLFEDALRLCIKVTMQNMYRCVHGDGTMAPPPLLKMVSQLDDKEIAYSPSHKEVREAFSVILSDIIDIVKCIPRLHEKFGLPDTGLKKFHEVISMDTDINYLQELINTDINDNLKAVISYIQLWEPYKYAWEIDKDEYLAEFQQQKPSVKDFDDKICMYNDLANTIQMAENVATVNFIVLRSVRLKKSAIEHCMVWQVRLAELLRKITENDIDNIYSYMESNKEEMSHLPKTISDLAAFISRYEQLINEVPNTEDHFPHIKEEMVTLEKFEVDVSADMYERESLLPELWAAYLIVLEDAKKNLELCKDQFKNELLDQTEVFKENAKTLLDDFKKTCPVTSEMSAKDALAFLKSAREQLHLMREKEQELRDGLAVFNLSTPDNPDLLRLERELEKLEEVWGFVNQWEESWEKYKEGDFWTIETDEMEENINNLFRNFNRLSRALKDRKWEIIENTRVRVEAFRRTIPLLTDLKNPCMRQRHWDRIKVLMGVDFDQNDPDFKLELIMKLNFQAYADDIGEISTAATQELAIENGLKNITEIWKTTKFEMEFFRDDIYRIKNVDDCNQFLEDHQIQLSAFKSTKYVEPFIKTVDYWEKALGYVTEAIENSLQVQRRWLYLENIFSGEDIRKQLPSEVQLFDMITADWREITRTMYTGINAVEACHYKPPPYLYNKLNKMVDNLEAILRALESYLETKRQLFPRFYFISNDDMLEILGNSKRPDLIQIHLKKIFDNLVKMKLDKNSMGLQTARGIMSDDGEVIEWKYPLLLDGPAEIWLSSLEHSMRVILKDLMIQTRAALRKAGNDRENWINEWPGQLGITCSKIQWTTDCIRTLSMCKIVGEKKPLKKLRKKQNKILATLSTMSRKEIPKILRLKVNALAVIEIHSRDTVEKMYKANCMDISAFEWFSQLKFFWDRDKEDVMIRQTNTEFIYTYEYIGNSGRLVITPLTDRCYITLTNALSLFRGGSPQGPAGTGKTETVKDLGRAMARWVVVTNCSDGLDYKSMAKCYAGIAQTGCWGCFDEFNRISLEVLSVVAQQILSVLLALSLGLKKFIFEGSEIKLISSGGIFITMNPGYAGRTELPDNLKSMFRPISMCVPDNLIIAENTLFSDGFQYYKQNAKKVFTLYQLAILQLSKQDHYDFGLRSMVALLRYAGAKRREHPNLPEAEVTFLAMRDMNIARLTAKDVPLFEGIMKDIFPDVAIPVLDYMMMNNAISAEMKLVGLQPIPTAMHKVIQVYETKNSRHSTMILGDTNTAKTVTWKILQSTLIRLKGEKQPGFEYVYVYPLNPKALNLGELYGEYNLATGEWQDGVISSVMRNICQDESPEQKWILFDGPVDAVWIENLNSVMDDNKLLTLINSERINLPPMVSLLFEAGDLAVASPATVSRCGIVYNDYRDWGWWPLVNSWLDTLKDEAYVAILRPLFSNLLAPALEYKRVQLSEGPGVVGQELTGVRSMCLLLKIMAPVLPTAISGDKDKDDDAAEFITKIWFIFCMIWSVFSTLEDFSRPRFDTWLRENEGVFPIKDTVYDYYVDSRLRQFMPWDDKLSDTWRYNPEAGFHTILVPTIESIRVQILAITLLQNQRGVLIGGPSGTGKSAVITGVLNNFDPEFYSNLVINMSAQTSSANVQDMIEARLEKRTKGNYVPAGGKKMITFVDDMNMPARDEYGSQPPLEFMRQFVDYGFWYDRIKQGRRNIKDIMMITAVGPPGGARSPLPSRLLSCFHPFYLPTPSQTQLIKIFGTMLVQHLVEFDEDTKATGKIILIATIDMFNNVCAKLLPTPSKMHYLFNLRDISKIFQGLLRSNKDYHNTRPQFLRLWIHECYRVFFDRLIDEKDRDWYSNQMVDMLGKHFELTFHNLCPSKQPPIFGHFINPYQIYEDIMDPDVLRKFIAVQLADYNASPGVVRMDLVLFKDAIDHVCRIVRVISQPRGNMLLVGIGGSGRQSLTRLGSFICEYYSFQVVVVKNYGVKEFREDLKVLYNQCGIDNKKTTFIFSDTQIAEESFTEIINNLLSSGEITNLYKADEFEDVKSSLEKPMKFAGITGVLSNEAVMLFLVNRVRSNLHIVFCMSPIGESFRNRLRQYPALINYTTTDWFLEWPREALLEVAYKYLKDVELVASITGEQRVRRKESVIDSTEDRLRAAVASIMSLIHSSVGHASVKLWLEQRRTNYVTPTNYLELVSGYKDMLNNKRIEIASNANKLRNGLSKIGETHASVEVMSADLEVAKEQVAEFTQQCIEYMSEITLQQRHADEQKRSVAARSKKTMEEEAQCQKLAAAAQRDLATAMPALEEAIAALDSLNKKDLTEIKSYAKPPQRVEMVMEAVMILLGVDPTWAESKKQLGDQQFLENLRNYDKDHIPEKRIQKIGTYTKKADFDPDIVGTVSTAAKSLCLWVRAIEKYGKIFKIVKPKKERLDEALESLRLKQQMLAEAMAKLRELAETLERLQKEYDEKLIQKEELARKAIQLQMMLDRAEALLEGLSGERTRWEVTVERLDAEFENLPGDCLMATAFISYIGPFTSNFREALAAEWMQEVKVEEVPHSSDLNMKTFLLDDALLRDWNIMGLPGDAFSAENGIIVSRATRWPLAVDPQGQALIWISNMEEENNILVLDFGQPDYPKLMEKALNNGLPVLIQGVVEQIDPSIAPILDKAVVIIGPTKYIKFNDKMIPYNPNFRLFLCTKLGNPSYTPEVLTKTTMVNFAVKEEGLQAQLLGIVVRKEKPQLEQIKDTLVLSIAKNKKTLVDLENELLRLLNESEGSLLENDELFETLQISRKTSTEVNEALETSQVTEAEIDRARRAYIPVAERASVLFFVLNDLSLIDPMYQFSLEAYNDLFMYSIGNSKKSSDLSDRIAHLIEFHTYMVYKNTCRALFECHKLLFSFHMVAKIQEQRGKMNMVEYMFFLKGGIVLDRSEQPDNPTNWMPEECWDNITELDKLPGFHGVTETFEVYTKEWNVWYLYPEPETQNLIGDWNNVCSDFQKMLFVRSLRRDRVNSCVSSYIVNILGPRYVEPPVLDIKAAWEESTFKTSLLFVLSPGVDPTASLIQLATDLKMFEKFQSLSLGQGQSVIAQRLLAQGMREGGWVFLANCHLACAWLATLRGLDSPKIHQRFRLWLSSMPDPSFPLTMLQRSIKMTTEPPTGLKGNLVRLFANLNEEKFDNGTPKYRKLLFCVSFFHCSLIARKRFRELGYNVCYSFNDADFDVSENLLCNYLDQYPEVPWDALKYLFAIINYGGHVTDDWDKRVLVAYINQFFCVEALETPYFRFSTIPSYHLPRDGSLQSYRDFVDVLPGSERAESVGQHAAADVACQAQDARALCGTLLQLFGTGGGGGAESSTDEKVSSLAAEMITKLPAKIDIEVTERMMGPDVVMPMSVSLLQELGYFNVLISGIVANLKELGKAIEGLLIMSELLEEVYLCIFEGRVPQVWQKARPSMKPLGSWCRELGQRGQALGSWAGAPRKPPTLCWLPTFVAPTAFLTSVMQTTARAEKWPIDTLCWDFIVQSLDEQAFVRPPRDGGVYIRGLFLEGASWFKKDGYIAEPTPMNLVCSMPVILFKPILQGGKKPKNRYICPTYYNPGRKGVFVVGVEMPAGQGSSEFWVKRGTALLCTLAA